LFETRQGPESILETEFLRDGEGRADNGLMEYHPVNLMEALHFEEFLCRMDWANRFRKMGYCLGIQDIMRRAYWQIVKTI